jgi:antirestriction protein ArdC
MVKQYRKNDNTVTVKGDDGKILTNLPAPETLTAAKTKLDNIADLNPNTENPNNEGKTWSELQKEHTEGLLKTIETEFDRLVESGDIDNFINHMSKFHKYSLNNQMLIWIQNPEATEVAGYNRWEEMGRQVRKGERGMDILAPITFKVKETNPITGEEKEQTYMKGFRAVKVFDIEQTEPAEYVFTTEAEKQAFMKEWKDKGYEIDINPENPLKLTIAKAPTSPAKLLEGEAPKEMITFVEEELKIMGVTYEMKTTDEMGGANGQSWKDPRTGEIKVSVRSDVDDAQKYKTLVHEMMHIQLGHLDRMDEYKQHGHRGEMEIAVETLSYMVGNRFGLDTKQYSTGYMAMWSGQNKEKLKKVLDEEVLPFYKKISEKLPNIEPETPPMGTLAQRKRANKAAAKTKPRWRKK